MVVFIKIPDGLDDGKYFFSKDAPNDIGIYKVNRYESGIKRHVYVTSMDTIKEASELCRKLNDGLVPEKELQNIIQRKKEGYSTAYFDSDYYEDHDWQRENLAIRVWHHFGSRLDNSTRRFIGFIKPIEIETVITFHLEKNK